MVNMVRVSGHSWQGMSHSRETYSETKMVSKLQKLPYGTRTPGI